MKSILTMVACAAGYAWWVFFFNGNADYSNKTFGYYVRAVRGGL